jgi:hypothetical protein
MIGQLILRNKPANLSCLGARSLGIATTTLSISSCEKATDKFADQPLEIEKLQSQMNCQYPQNTQTISITVP